MNKNLTLKITLTIVCLIILILTITFIPKNQDKGTITIILKDETNEIIKKDIYEFTKNDTFFNILENNYDIVMGTGSKKGMILKINELDVTNNKDYYIKILINEQYSNYGVKNIPLNDEDIITFVIEKIGDSYEK